MNIERDTENNIIVRDTQGNELHPYVTTLAAIEFQQKIFPPRVPQLSTQGWDVVVACIKEAIDKLGNTAYKTVETHTRVEHTSPIAAVKEEDATETVVSTVVESTESVVETNVNAQQQTPTIESQPTNTTSSTKKVVTTTKR